MTITIHHDTPMRVGEKQGCVFIQYSEPDRKVVYHSLREDTMLMVRKLFKYDEDTILVSPTDKEYQELITILNADVYRRRQS